MNFEAYTGLCARSGSKFFVLYFQNSEKCKMHIPETHSWFLLYRLERRPLVDYEFEMRSQNYTNTLIRLGIGFIVTIFSKHYVL